MGYQPVVLIVLLPLVISFFVFFSGWWLKRCSFPLVLGALGGCLILSIAIFRQVLAAGPLQYRLGLWQPPLGIEYRVDSFNASLLVLVTVLGLLAGVYGQRPVEAELKEKTALFWCLFLLLVTGMLGIIVTADLFNLFVLLEVTSLTGYTLVAIGSDKAVFASYRYLILGTIGASFYLIGIGYLYIMSGSLNMADLRAILPPLYTTRVVQAAFVFILVGLGIKIALFPLHAWQPDAYTYAPSAVSVILSTAVAKTLIYALIRVTFSVFTLDFALTFLPLFDLLCWIAAIAMIAGSIFAIAQQNFKRMLAYSSIANVGYIVLAVGLSPGTALGLNPAVMHIVNHALIKGCMFMAACAIVYKLGLTDVRQFAGLSRRMPLTCFSLLLAVLAIIGMPPSGGFVTKWYLILAAIDAGKFYFVGFIFASTLLMIVYFWRLIENIYVREAPPEQTGDDTSAMEAPASMVVPLFIMGLATFGIGLVWISGILSPVLASVNSLFGLGGP